MKPEKYQKRPVVIEAMPLTHETFADVKAWLDSHEQAYSSVEWEKDRFGPSYLNIHTLEGVMTVSLRDWVIRGVAGEFYACKPDIFEMTYVKAPTP